MKHIFMALCLLIIVGCDMTPGMKKDRTVTEVRHCQAIGLDAEFIYDNGWSGVDVVRCVEPGTVDSLDDAPAEKGGDR